MCGLLFYMMFAEFYCIQSSIVFLLDQLGQARLDYIRLYLPLSQLDCIIEQKHLYQKIQKQNPKFFLWGSSQVSFFEEKEVIYSQRQTICDSRRTGKFCVKQLHQKRVILIRTHHRATSSCWLGIFSHVSKLVLAGGPSDSNHLIRL